MILFPSHILYSILFYSILFSSLRLLLYTIYLLVVLRNPPNNKNLLPRSTSSTSISRSSSSGPPICPNCKGTGCEITIKEEPGLNNESNNNNNSTTTITSPLCPFSPDPNSSSTSSPSNNSKGKSYQYSCMFDGVELPAEVSRSTVYVYINIDRL